MGERLEDLMKSVLEDIKNQEYKQAYLFFGEEGYLKKQYRNKLLQAWNPDGDTMNESRFSRGSDSRRNFLRSSSVCGDPARKTRGK